jgi:hypothetical protein
MALTTATISPPATTLADGFAFRRRLWLALVGVGLLIAGALVGEAIRATTAPPGPRTLGQDLLPGYVAGRMVMAGQYHELYIVDAVARCAAQVTREADLAGEPRHAAWINPPFYAWAFVPLAALPYRMAAVVYLAFNLGLFTVACLFLCRLVARGRPKTSVEQGEMKIAAEPVLRPDWRTRALVPAVLLCSAPFWQVMAHQQNTFLSLAIAAAAVWLARNGRSMLAGTVAGLLLFKPQLGAAVGVATVFLAGRRAAIGLLYTAVGLVGLSEWTTPGSLLAWARGMPQIVHGLQHDYAYNWCRQVTLRGFWRLLVQGNAKGDTAVGVEILWAVTWLALAGPLAVATIRAWRGSAADRERGAIALLVSMPLLMPYFMDYDLLLLSVPAVLMAITSRTDRPSARHPMRWTAAWTSLFATTWLNPLLAPALRVNLTVVALLPLVGMCLAAYMRRDEEPARISQERRPLAAAA